MKKNTMLSNPSFEAGKEVGRLLFFGVLSSIVSALLERYAGWNDQGQIFGLVFLALKYFDKWVHEKEEGLFKEWKGISPV